MSFVPEMPANLKTILFEFAHKIYCLRSYYIYFPEGTFKTVWKIFSDSCIFTLSDLQKLSRTLYQMRLLLLFTLKEE